MGQWDQWRLWTAGTQVQSLTWRSRLRIQCGIGHNCDVDLTPGLGTLYAFEVAKKKKKANLLPDDSEPQSSWSPSLRYSPKATPPPSPAPPGRRIRQRHGPRASPSICLEILPGGLLEVTSPQDQFPLPGLIPPKFTCQSPSCFHAARTCKKSPPTLHNSLWTGRDARGTWARVTSPSCRRSSSMPGLQFPESSRTPFPLAFLEPLLTRAVNLLGQWLL